MASVMGQSAASGHHAGEMMRKADALESEVAEPLQALVATSRESAAASAKIAGIAKVVEEIAFQTNMLVCPDWQRAGSDRYAAETGGDRVYRPPTIRLSYASLESATAGILTASGPPGTEGFPFWRRLSDNPHIVPLPVEPIHE